MRLEQKCEGHACATEDSCIGSGEVKGGLKMVDEAMEVDGLYITCYYPACEGGQAIWGEWGGGQVVSTR